VIVHPDDHPKRHVPEELHRHFEAREARAWNACLDSIFGTNGEPT
jgi:hypothetical protein